MGGDFFELLSKGPLFYRRVSILQEGQQGVEWKPEMRKEEPRGLRKSCIHQE